MNVRARLETLERSRPANVPLREMSTPDLEAMMRGLLGHDPTDEELAGLAAMSDEDLEAFEQDRTRSPR